MVTLTLVVGYIITVLLGLVGLVIVWKIFDGSIDLSELLEESNGGASMSRFQLLIFTFVFAFSLFLVIVSTSPASFPNIPGTVLSLLGISGSSYLVSKGIQFSDPAGLGERGTDVVIQPPKVNLGLGESHKFTVKPPDAQVQWELIAGEGTLSPQGLYTAPKTKPPAVGAADHFHATVQVTSTDHPGAYDLAVVTIKC